MQIRFQAAELQVEGFVKEDAPSHFLIMAQMTYVVKAMIAHIDAARILPLGPAEYGQVGSGFSEPARPRSGRSRKFPN